MLLETKLCQCYNVKTLDLLSYDDWVRVVKQYKLNTVFVLKYKAYIDFTVLGRSKRNRSILLDNNVLRIIANRLDSATWSLVLHSMQVDLDILISNKARLKSKLSEILSTQHITLDLVRCLELDTIHSMPWYFVKRGMNIDIEVLRIPFVQKSIAWYRFSEYIALDTAILDACEDLIDWLAFSKRSDLTEAIMIKYRHKLDWSKVCLNNTLSEYMLKLICDTKGVLHLGYAAPHLTFADYLAIVVQPNITVIITDLILSSNNIDWTLTNGIPYMMAHLPLTCELVIKYIDICKPYVLYLEHNKSLTATDKTKLFLLLS